MIGVRIKRCPQRILEAAMGLQTGLWPLDIFIALFLQVVGLIDN